MKPWLAIIIIVQAASHTAAAQTLGHADSLLELEQYEAAIKAYSQFFDAGDLLDRGNAHLRTGKAWYLLNQPDRALPEYFEALTIFEQLQNRERLAAAALNIANVYNDKTDERNSEKYWNAAFRHSAIIKDSARQINILNDKALLLYKKKLHREAATAYLKTLEDYKSKMNPEVRGRLYTNVAMCYGEFDVDSAIYYFERAEKEVALTGDTVKLSIVFNNLGEMYRRKQNFQRAKTNLLQSHSLNKFTNDTLQRIYTFRNLSDVYAAIDKPDSALFFLQQATFYNDIMLDGERVMFAAELSEKYESGKKDQKIRSQEFENKLKTRNMVLSLAGAALAAALAMISYVSYKRKQKVNKALLLQNERIEKLNKELDRSNQVKTKLFSVISHDLRAPVSSLYAWLQMNTAASAGRTAVVDQAEHLLDTLEDLLVWSKSQLHQFNPVIEKIYVRDAIEQVVALFASLLHSKKITTGLNIPGHFVIETDPNILSIVLRNIISNAAKSAAADSTINIDAVTKHHFVVCTVKNEVTTTAAANFFTESHSTETSSSGLGLKLIREFTEKIGGNVSYTAINHQITTVLELPLIHS